MNDNYSQYKRFCGKKQLQNLTNGSRFVFCWKMMRYSLSGIVWAGLKAGMTIEYGCRCRREKLSEFL